MGKMASPTGGSNRFPLEPVVPFEPVVTDTLPSGEEWIAQIKWDGVRMLAYADGGQSRLFNRRRNERTMQYPEIADIASYCTADSVILDGEIIALVDGKPSFHQVMKRDSLRSETRVRQIRQAIPVIYMVFDLLYWNGRWLLDHPLRQRQAYLAELIQPNDCVQLVPSYPELQAMDEVAQQHGLEGIVCKDLDSTYVLGGKDRRWLKKKHFRDLIAVVGGVTHRAGTVNALLLGLYDETGQLWYIGHAGSGKLTVQDWRELTDIAGQLRINRMPFVNRPERFREATWIQPALTVKIQYLEWTEARTLRHPVIQAFVDTPPSECTF